MARTKRIEVQVVGDARKAESAIKGVGDAAGKLEGDMKSAGEEASAGFLKGFDVDGVTSGIKGGFGKLAGVAKTAMMGAGVAAGGALVVGINNAMDVEAATDKLTAQLGGGEWAEGMGDIAGNLYTEAFGESVADTADAVRMVVQRHLLPEDATNDAIEGLTAQFLTFTDVLEQDMDMATQAVGRMIKSGIAEDGTEALDILTRGIQQGADNATDLLETFQEYSTMFRDIGIDAEDATGLMVQGLAAGARDGDKVADALKEIAIRGQDASELSAHGFEMIGLSAEEMTRKFADGGPAARDALDQVLDGLQEMEDPVKRNEAAIALFGTQAEDLGDALFALDLDDAAMRLGDHAGAVDGLGSAYDNASTRLETFKRKGMMRLTEFAGNVVIPALEDVGDWVADNWPPVQEKILAVFEDVKAWVQSNWPGFRDTVMGVFNSVKGWVDTNWPPFKESVLSVFNAVAAWVRTNWPKFKQTVLEAFDSIKATVDRNWPAIKETITNAMVIIGGAIAASVALIKQIWNRFGANILEAVRITWERIKSEVRLALGLIRGIIKVVSSLIRGDWSGVWDGIKQIFRTAWDFMLSMVRLAIDSMKLILSTAWNVIKQTISARWTAIKAVFGLLWDGIKTAAGNAVSSIVTFFTNLPGNLLGLVGSLSAAALSLGAAIGDGLVGAIKSALGVAVSVAGELGDIGISVANAVIGVVNSGIASLNAMIPNHIGFSVAGRDIGFDVPESPIPSIPTLAEGGIARATPGGILANIGEGRHDEAVIPLPRGFHPDDIGKGGDTYMFDMRGAVIADEAQFRRMVRKALRDTGSRGDPVTLGRGRRIG